MAKRATSSKAVSKRSASKKKAKRAGVKARKAKATVEGGGRTTAVGRAGSGASTRVASQKVKKTAKKAKRGKSGLVGRRPASDTVAREAELSAASHVAIDLREKRRHRLKTYLTPKQLAEFKLLLLTKRAELAGDVQHLTHDAFDRKGQGRGGQSAMPIHMADIGSDNWEQEFTLGLIENEQAVIREIDEALARIKNKTYGMCLATRKRISLARLRAKPWAKYCIAYARAREEGRAL